MQARSPIAPDAAAAASHQPPPRAIFDGVAERGAEARVEGRQVAEAAVEGDRRHALGRFAQARRGAPQSRRDQILMRRRADGAAEDAQEVELGQPRDARQRREVERFVVVPGFDRARRLGDALEFARRRARRGKRAAGDDRDDARRRLQRALLDPQRRTLRAPGPRARRPAASAPRAAARRRRRSDSGWSRRPKRRSRRRLPARDRAIRSDRRGCGRGRRRSTGRRCRAAARRETAPLRRSRRDR